MKNKASKKNQNQETSEQGLELHDVEAQAGESALALKLDLEPRDTENQDSDEGGADFDLSADGSADEDNQAESDELALFDSNLGESIQEEGFLPEVSEDMVAEMDSPEQPLSEAQFEGSELEDFESAEIEDVEFVEEERLDSILESILFASDRPVSLNSIKLVFKGTNVRGDKIRKALDRLAVELAGSRRGVTLEEVPGGYQIRTKVDNMEFLTRTLKARPFRLSGPALEVLAIVAYKQPMIKAEIDEIRGVESGHLLRALMEKGLVNFEGKSDLPGKPMLYATTRKFLEIFSLRNLKELPTLSQIDELLPEGIDEASSQEKPTLSQLTDSLSQEVMTSYSDGEEELSKITEQLQVIETTSNFFEEEKLRQKQKRDADKAQSLREALLVGEEISTRDKNWLTRYDEAMLAGDTAGFAKAELVQSGELKIAQAATDSGASHLSARGPDGAAIIRDGNIEGGDQGGGELASKIQDFDQDLDLESASFDEAPADDEELAVPYHDDDGDTDTDADDLER